MPGDPGREVGYQQEREKERLALLRKVQDSIGAFSCGLYNKGMEDLLEVRHRLDWEGRYSTNENSDR